MGSSSDPQQREALSEREEEIYQLRVVNRWVVSRIAEKFGISPQRVSQIIKKVRQNQPPLDFEGLRQESLELHRRSQQMALALAEREGAPVFVGKDGSMAFDENGQPVRDYSLRLQALETARKADLEIRKLHGLDAATKIEQSGTVRYEIAGVEPDALS